MHWTDSYPKVTWRKSGELDSSMISAVTVWLLGSPASHLLRPIPRLNSTSFEGIDQLRHQRRAFAISSISQVRANHSSCQGASWLDSETLCSLQRLVSPSFP